MLITPGSQRVNYSHPELGLPQRRLIAFFLQTYCFSSPISLKQMKASFLVTIATR